MAETVSDALVRRLTEWGVDTIFGLPGDGINGFMEALRKRRDDVRFVHTRHEETAALAACAYAKFTGRLGVCLSTAAPGAIHLLNGLYDAAVDQAPVLAVTGMTYHDLMGTKYLQDLNHDYLFADVAAFNQRLMGPGHVENVANLACRSALSNRSVSHICIPIDFQVAEMDEADRFKRNVPGHTAGAEGFVPPRPVPPESHVERAADLLRGRRRVAILAGAGARGAGRELEELAEKLGAVIVKALLGKDCVPDDSPYVTGGTGVVGTRPSQEAFARCDALIVVGSSFPYIEFLPPPGGPACVQIDDRPERIGLRHPVDVGLVGDAQLTLQQLIPRLERNDDRTFLEEMQQSVRGWWDLMKERGTRDDVPMKPQVPVWHLNELLDDDAIVCGDSGTVTTWIARWKLRGRQRFSFSGTMCSMMAALPYSIGAQAAYPGRQVVAYTGDGSLTMMLGDLATLAQERLPVKVIVNKNCTLGLIKWEQQIFLGNPEYGCDFNDVDFVKVAEGCGVPGIRIDDPTRCRDQLARALELDGPAVIECVTDPHEPPHPPQVTREQTKLFAEALARGQEHRRRIALTVGRDMLKEADYSASPYGVPARLKEKFGAILPGGNGRR
ncbi:MAG TPA: thiamine pyrophosphate-dependent enzyme [Gaiellales bacterium]|jgi:pyruvate dehydrogenase (quinone)/pyruvate oxidase|nr:thiamine pyrophosphate-dependent enzyme [Gaiellales bacterium]